MSVHAKETVLIVELIEGTEAAAKKLHIDFMAEEGVSAEPLASHGVIIDGIIESNPSFTGHILEGQMMSEKFWAYVDRKIKDEKIKYVNMSFMMLMYPMFAKPPYLLESGEISEEQKHTKAKNMVQGVIDGNPDTLFVVASGNGVQNFLTVGIPIDKGSFQAIPASFRSTNMLTVAALATGSIDPDLLDTYKISYFANMGLKNVDVLAPGESVGGNPEATGTSFAAPSSFAAIDRVLQNIPDASLGLIQEIVIKSVYIPDVTLYLSMPYDTQFSIITGYKADRDKFLAENPLYHPVKSGGIVFTDRAEKVAAALAQKRASTVEEAVLSVLKDEGMTEGGSIALKAFWQQRGI